MKLLDLNPRWVAIHRWDDLSGTQHYYDNPPRIGGISFDCPTHIKYCECCKQSLKSSHRLVVWFKNPKDGMQPQVTEYLWNMEGDNFENITLIPSINVSEFIDKETNTACWHGHIKNGEVI